MSEIELLNWARGPGFQLAVIIFIAGVAIRLLETLLLGRKPNLAEPKGTEMSSGLRTILTRTLPAKGMLGSTMFTVVSGYIFHIGLFVTIFLFAPHILMFKQITGLSWLSLPTPAVDAVTVVTIIALLVVLAHRFVNKVLRFLTNTEDLLVWVVTILPMLTGYMAFHRIGATAQTLLALHILSVDLLLVVFPFTKLMHTFTLFFARWYNGAISGRRGVES